MKEGIIMLRSKIKKIIAIAICITMSISVKMPVLAADDTKENQVNTLLDKMTENLALSLLEKDSEDIQKYEEENEQIENQLAMLGVKELNENELQQFLGERGVNSARISKPADGNTVKWYLNNAFNYTYNSVKYDVQILIAVGNNPGGMLVTGEDNYKFYSDEKKIANIISTAASIIVQKGIGLIRIIKWTPYELLFSNSSSNVFNSGYITHRCVSSIAFTFVKEASYSDDYYELSLFSNKLNIASNTHGAAVVNSVPKTYSQQKTAMVEADHYNSIPAAIKSYRGEAGCYDYISYYELQSCDGQYKKKVYVPNPLAGPGQVY